MSQKGKYHLFRARFSQGNEILYNDIHTSMKNCMSANAHFTVNLINEEWE